MSFLSEIRGFKQDSLKHTDTTITTRTGEQYLQTRDADGHVTETLVGKLDIRDEEVANIIPGLYLGSQHVAENIALLKENTITHILNVTTNVPNHFTEQFSYKNINIPDLSDTVLTDSFPESFSFIDEVIKNGGHVLVHCNLGQSRSASIVIGYLMSHEHMTFKDAFDHVKSKRSVICPNYGFRQQLEAYKPT